MRGFKRRSRQVFRAGAARAAVSRHAPCMHKLLYIFGLLTDLDIHWIARAGARRRLKDGDSLIERGKPLESVFLVLEGELVVSTKHAGAIARRGAGEIVGEMSLVDSAPASATVVADGESLILSLSKNMLQQKLAADLGFGFRFYKGLAIVLADRLREMQEQALSHGHYLTAELKGEIDGVIVRQFSSAGERFDRMLRVLKDIDADT